LLSARLHIHRSSDAPNFVIIRRRSHPGQYREQMMNIPIQGISISQTDEVIHIQSEGQLVTFSSAIIGGGLSHVRHIINAHVDKNFNSSNPKNWLRSLAATMDIHGSFIGLMTAVKLSKARITFLESDGLGVCALVTAGVRNASAAGITPPFISNLGTINIILLLQARLTRAAMLNAVITATETKTAVLMEKNILTPDGDAATGTSTDTVTIAATNNGALQAYGGPVTTIGWLIARAVRESLQQSLDAE
jgi:adenosylcobinamide hydrolase